MAITLKKLYNSILPFVNASPDEVNMFVCEALGSMSQDRLQASTVVTIETLSTAKQEISITDTILSIKAVFIDGDEVYDYYSAPASTFNYVVDFTLKKIIFSEEVESGSVITAEVLSYIDNENLTFTSSTSFSVPSSWINAVKYYVLSSIFTTEAHYDPNKSIFYRSKHRDELIKIRDNNANLADSYMDLGDTL